MEMNQDNQAPNGRPHRRRRRLWHRLLTTAAVVGLIGGAVYVLLPAEVASARGWIAQRHGCYGHGEGGGWFGPPTAEEMQERARKVSERALERLDATDAQRETILAIVDRAVIDIAELRLDRQGLREVLFEELTAPSVDRDALEALRRQKLESFDKASTRILGAVANIADVLTVEQRTRLADHIRQRHG